MASSQLNKPLESVIYKQEVLTVTYTQNQYATSSNVSGIAVRRHGLLYAIEGNFYLSNTMTSNDFIEIGKINNYSASKSIRLQIPSMNAATALALMIQDNGTIKISGSNIPAGWYRFHAAEAVWNP